MFNHGSHGIQSEGWTLTLTEKAGSGARQSGKSKGRQNRATRECTCEHCGKQYQADLKSKGRFCSYDCFYNHKRAQIPTWFQCSTCLAKVGYGVRVAARLVNVNKGQVSKIWKRFNVKTNLPECGEWRRYALREQSNVCGWWGNEETGNAWMQQHKEKFPDWSSIWNYEKLLRYQRARYHALNPEKKRQYNQKWKSANPNIRRETLKKWKQKNPERCAELNRKAQKKMRSNPMNRVVFNMRNRFKEIMDGVRCKPTQGRWELIGCSQQQLKTHLESLFKKGMSWANYGSHWHVDHIIPCAKFDHTDPKQVKQCWHWTNLQPLEAKKNFAKSDRITDGQLSLLLCATH